LKTVADRGIPLLLVSAIFREQQVFFKSYGGFHRKMLHLFTRLFVQDNASKHLLETIGVTHSTVNGDTRFDRVAAIAETAAAIPLMETYAAQGTPLFIAGSTWPEDEQLLHDAGIAQHYRLVIAPHEISVKNTERLLRLFGKEAATYSSFTETGVSDARVLVVDNMGMLSRLYRYARLTYIGGGFNKSGIHNTLEAAAWRKPVLFGPNYKKFREAQGLIACGAAYSAGDAGALKEAVIKMEARYESAAEAAVNYVQEQAGATAGVLRYIQENRLLTRS
jgi:3-deoxy-D-manno-octulosonic-acid transferase